MTENKRFTMEYTSNAYEVMYLDKKEVLTDLEVLNLLNELHEENKELKTVLLETIDELWEKEKALDWEYGVGNELEQTKKELIAKYSKYGWSP